MRLIDADALGVGRCSKDVLPAEYCAGWNGLLNLVETAPTIDPSSLRPKGEWITYENGVVVCSNCGEEHEWIDYRASFCDNCGADMSQTVRADD